MLLRPSTWVLVGLLVVLPTVCSHAQDGSTPSPAAPSVGLPAKSEAVLLVYKYPPGEIQTTRMSMKSDFTFTLLGNATVPTPVTITETMTVLNASRVLGVDANGGTVRSTITGLESRMNTRDQEVVCRLQGGKLLVSKNGVRLPDGDPQGNSARNVMAKFPLVAYSNKRGETRLPSPAARASDHNAAAAGGFGNLDPDFTVPDYPVRVGDEWETKSTWAADHVTGRTTHRLREIRRSGNRRLATIETAQEMIPTEGSAGTLLREARIESVSYFDIDRGAITRSEFTVSLSGRITRENGRASKMNIPVGGHILLDGKIESIIQETTPAIAKSAKR